MSKTQQQALKELKACAQRLGSTPTAAQFNADPKTTIPSRRLASLWPGGWREALAAADLNQGWSNEALSQALRLLATRLGKLPTSRDINASSELPSAALYLRRFGSLKAARKAAGLDSMDRSSAAAIIRQGVELSAQLGHLPSWSEWTKAHKADPLLASEWQVYRRFGGGDGAWRMFHYCLLEAGAS